MPSKQPQTILRTSKAQKKKLKNLASMRGMDQAEYLRWLIESDCKALGIEWPDDLTQRGKYSRKQK